MSDEYQPRNFNFPHYLLDFFSRFLAIFLAGMLLYFAVLSHVSWVIGKAVEEVARERKVKTP